MKILVTGSAGFIGSHASYALTEHGHDVLGVDNLNDYYDPALKDARLERLAGRRRFSFEKLDISDDVTLGALTAKFAPDRILHLAAQAGVRYSIENPMAYARSNLMGHLSVLEAARHTSSVKHLAYASSSSVYGERDDAPFRETDPVENPVSLYAATKRADELMSATYCRLYGIAQTGLRFFTVYGPWGRPDMAYWLFTKAILAGEPIKVFNQGNMARDFTHVDDVVRTLVKIVETGSDTATHKIYNIGGSNPRPLNDFISAIEQAVGQTAEKIMMPMQKGDVRQTSADVSALVQDFGYAATTQMEDGVQGFVDWYRGYFNV